MTDRQTDGRHHDADIQSYCITALSAKMKGECVSMSSFNLSSFEYLNIKPGLNNVTYRISISSEILFFEISSVFIVKQLIVIAHSVMFYCCFCFLASYQLPRLRLPTRVLLIDPRTEVTFRPAEVPLWCGIIRNGFR